MRHTLEETRSAFIEKIGLKAQADGLPRIAGRVLGLLIWDGTAVSFASLADQLMVSRGSISSATRILLERRLIKRIAKAGERQDFFQLSDAPYVSMMEATKISLDNAKDEIDATLNDIPDAQTEIKARVAAYADFYGKMSKAVDGILTDMRS
ncbi:hypothetical protein [uncultured Lentibacter sp.]|uniref:GbsR/MarR family transcriptional regulator n=1 Tax=uncultured Lentibacter sp. TaxID=1659309 RepID=UPI00262978C3|nr:hypothetical protein [uncultured Lentibacter sp.]MCW1956703.1 hypothetical protein [Roseobacter sp.]